MNPKDTLRSLLSDREAFERATVISREIAAMANAKTDASIARMNRDRFPKRIVLGAGFPWSNGTGPGYFDVHLRHIPVGGINMPLDWPAILWSKELPMYRLVLERIDDEAKEASQENPSP